MIFDGYKPIESFHDEVFSSNGSIRKGWEDFVKHLEGIGHSDLTRRWLQGQEEMLANGIAYNLYDESTGFSRPWELDLIPQLIGVAEWEALSKGLRQRATLLNLLLGDLYGEQQSLRDGYIPAEWLFSNPAFRPVFHGQQPAESSFLQFYAADLAKAPDGRWWIIADRTDAPLGLGYALENRIVTSRMLPHAIGNFNVERLAPFFLSFQETLKNLAPNHRDNPRIVLLSHGPTGPNYFEDAYLARYLGYTLVEGADLAVRDDHVFLKTLAGLYPVDVILRRLSDVFCDPLELRGDSRLGVPGLLQASRLGNVAIVNALGSSLVESPSLMPFLPKIAKLWLHEELLLPSVATWWGGDGSHTSEAAKRLENAPQSHAILPAFRVGRMDSLSSDDPATFLRMSNDRKEGRQNEIVVQERVQRSTSPVWCDGEPKNWHVALRCFLVNWQDGYHVMPGGLIRLARDSSELDTSVLTGKVCKDAWVQSEKIVQRVSLLSTSNEPVILRRSGAELPSRVADNLFWFGRNVERAQSGCRLIRPLLTRLTGEDEAERTAELNYLTACARALGLSDTKTDARSDEAIDWQNQAEHWPALALAEDRDGSLRNCVTSAHRNASLVRDRLSLDTWRVVHSLERMVSQAASAVADKRSTESTKNRFGLDEFDELMDEMIVRLAALDGLFAESMTRTPAFRFLDLGRRLERTLFNVNLVQNLPSEVLMNQGRILEAMLEVADGLMTYRGRYLAAVHQAAALDLLLTDETNPRSVVFQLNAITEHIVNLPHGDVQPLGTPEERIASSLLHSARMLSVEDLDPQDLERKKLGHFLRRVTEQLPNLSDLITRRYLIHAGLPRQMSDGWRPAP